MGARTELLVSADLMYRGYDVFRALSPSCNCDLVIFKNGEIVRVEVRTGYKNLRGDISYNKPPPDRSDVIAVWVHGQNKIVYINARSKETIDL